MFLRTVTRNLRSGPVQYVCLIHGYRENGQVRQRVVANLGRADVLAPHLGSLVELLRPYLTEPVGPLSAVQAPDALGYGQPVVARALWDQLGLGEIVKRHCGAEVAERAFVLAAHRLLHPGSEHALGWWLEESFVADGSGQRVLADWEPRDRVRIASRQLQRWYRTLDRLVAAKEAIERDLYFRLRDIFGVQVDLVFMDITSTYFEGAGPEGLARHGYSRDGRPRNRQVLVGVVMASGWPIASYVFEGHRADRSTVEEIVTDVRGRFALQRVIWVADRGMVSQTALEAMTEGEDRYLVGLQRRRNPTAQAVMAAANGPWQALPEGGTVSEVRLAGDPVRYLVARSPERLDYERKMRRQSMRRVRDQLRKLQQAVARGRVKAPEKVGAKAGAILTANHGARYFSWALDPEKGFSFRLDRTKLRAERRVEGTYILQTNDSSLDPVQAVAAYKELQGVERGFRYLKDVLSVRPVYHQTPSRVRGHLFVAHLALVLGCALEKKLRAAGLSMNLNTALDALRPVRLVTLSLAETELQVVTKPNSHAQAVLKAAGIRQLSAPKPGCCETA